MPNSFSVEVRNVNDGYNRTLAVLEKYGVEEQTRNGSARVLPGVFNVYVREPTQRVLFNEARDANPIFHLLEACWMLAGQRDVAFVSQFNSNMVNFSDDKSVFNAAYGHRWRHHFGYDQLERVIRMLSDNPGDRRAVVTMWDPSDDLGSKSLDIPCNQQLMFRVIDNKLCMFSTNRSNDAVWGLWGANCVHISFLQEWLAGALALGVGCWWHSTLNLHIYERHYGLLRSAKDHHLSWKPWPGSQSILDGTSAELFREECLELCNGKTGNFKSPFLEETVEPVLASWTEWKKGDKEESHHIATCIEANDWREAVVAWYERRM